MGNLPRNAEEYRRWYAENIPEGIEWGECWCGCGTTAKISPKTNRFRYWFKGSPRKFAPSHRKLLNERYVVEDRGHSTPCWIWTGYIAPSGYGMLPRRFNGTIYAHRWMYERTHGKQPSFPEHQLHHECEQKSCINPTHLKLLTNTEHRRTYNTKLDYDQAVETRRLYATGEYRHEDLAQRLQVSRATITRAINKKTWRDIR